MSIASGYKKFKKYILTSSGFQLVSHWTKANALEFDDGKTAQDKLGAIDGISSSRESNSDKIAASTALVSELNSDLGGYKFSKTTDGKPGFIVPGGADTVIPFKLLDIIDLGTGTNFDVTQYSGYVNYAVTDFIVEPIAKISKGCHTGGNTDYFDIYNTITLNKSYNSNTGIFSAYQTVDINAIGCQSRGNARTTSNAEVHAYLLLH